MRPPSSVAALSLAVAGTIALGSAACEQPQKGALSAGWCQPAAADSATLVMLDDMEDGDDRACPSWAGRWSVEATGASVPASGAPAKPQTVTVDLPVSHTAPSYRALYLSGSLAAGQYAQLTLPLSSVDLNDYKEVDFWSRSDPNPTLTLSVGVVTAAGAFWSDALRGRGATILTTWGDSGGPNNVALAALEDTDGNRITAAALAASTAIIFRYEAPDDGAFGFWIDDVQLKRSK